MKRSITLLLTTALFVWAGIAAVAQDGLTFGVISDIHVGSGTGTGYADKVPRALKCISGQGHLDAIAVAGDLTDNGSEAFFQELAAIAGDAANYTHPVGQMIFMMGNHDNYDMGGIGYYQKHLQPFNGGADYPLNSYRVIKGHAFIAVSMLTSGGGAYPEATKQWLAEQMAKAATECPGKAIFVFTHVPPMHTCYSTWPEHENGQHWGSDALNSVLNQYPQAIVFGGHSHYPLGDPRSIHQGVNPQSARQNYFTGVGTGSVTYSEIHPGAVSAGIHPEGYENVTEGLIVEVKDNGDVEIRRYDLTRGEEIGAANRWTVRAPHDGSQFAYGDVRDADDNPLGKALRTGGEAPQWQESMELEPAPYSLVVNIPQATDEECVFSYAIDITDLQGIPVSQKTFFSRHYLNSQAPAVLSVEVGGLRPEREYKMSLTATDCYGNVSEAQEEEFETPADDNPENDVPTPMGHWTFNDPDDLMAATEGQPLVPAKITGRTVTPVETPEAANIVYQPLPSPSNGSAFVPAFSSLAMPLSLDAPLQNYTLMMDVMAADVEGFSALLQTDPNNGGDADLFIYNGQVGVGDLGYRGEFAPGVWHRILCVCRGGEMNVYLNGKHISSVAKERFIVQPTGLFLFTDEDGEVKNIQVAEVAFWAEPLTEGQIMRLGDIDMGGFIIPSASSVYLMDENEFSFNIDANVPFELELPEWIRPVDAEPRMGDNTYTFSTTALSETGSRDGVISIVSASMDTKQIQVKQIFTGGILPQAASTWTFDDEANPLACDGVGEMLPAFNTVDGNVIAASLDEAGIAFLEAGPKDGNGAIGRAPLAYLWVKGNMGREPHSNYTLMMDVRPEVLAGFNSLYLNNTSHMADGSLFIRHDKVGAAVGGLDFGGQLQENVWHRVVAVVKGNMMSVYVDGELVCASATASEANWMLQPEFLLFADANGQEVWTDLAEVRLWDVPLTAAHVAQLGKVEQDEAVVEQMPDPYTVWNFDNPADVLAGTGPVTLSYAQKGGDGAPANCPDPAAAGFYQTTAPEGHVGLAVPVDGYLRFGLPDGMLETYTLVLDVRALEYSGYQSIYQSEPANNNDADIFFYHEKIGRASAGLGYHGKFEAPNWYRLAFVVENTRITIYANGDLIAQSDNGSSEWLLNDGSLLFADNDGEEKELHICGARLWNEVLSPGMVRRLGNPGESEAPVTPVEPEQPKEPAPDANTVWDFANAKDRLAATGSYSLAYAVKGAQGPEVVGLAAEAGIEETDAPEGTEGAITVPVDAYLRLGMPQEAEDTGTFSIMMDVRVRKPGGYQALFQGHPGNDDDGSLFVKDDNVGLNSVGLGYNGKVEEMKWHRITFCVQDQVMALYVDGKKIGQAAGPRDDWRLTDGVLFFADESGEEGVMDIAEMRLWDTCLNDAQVTWLGKAGTDPTGIHDVKLSDKEVRGIFDLLGRRLAREGKGIRIIDGRKVMVK